MNNNIKIISSEFKIIINGVECVAKHNEYTKFSNFEKYAYKMLNELWSSKLLRIGKEDFDAVINSGIFCPLKGNKYYNKNDVVDIARLLYNLKWRG